MSSFQSIRDLPVYAESLDLADEIYRLTRDDAIRRDFGYVDQLRRAAVSVVANISEGYGRFSSNREFARYLAMSRGSAFEVRTLLIIGRRVDYISAREFEELSQRVDSIIRQLTGFLKHLRRSGFSDALKTVAIVLSGYTLLHFASGILHLR